MIRIIILFKEQNRILEEIVILEKLKKIGNIQKILIEHIKFSNNERNTFMQRLFGNLFLVLLTIDCLISCYFFISLYSLNKLFIFYSIFKYSCLTNSSISLQSLLQYIYIPFILYFRYFIVYFMPSNRLVK